MSSSKYQQFPNKQKSSKQKGTKKNKKSQSYSDVKERTNNVKKSSPQKSQQQKMKQQAGLQPKQQFFSHKLRLTPGESHLKNILTNRLIYQQTSLDDSIFRTDLVIEMKLPTSQQTYIKRSQKLQLGSFLRKFPKSFMAAYESAYSELYRDMQQAGDEVHKQNNNDKQLLIRNMSSFTVLNRQQIQRKKFQHQQQLKQGINTLQKLKKVYTDEGYEEFIKLNYAEEYSGVLDSFIITYNTLIYALQQFCGFKVRAFMVSKMEEDDKWEDPKIVDDNMLMRELTLRNRGVQRTIFILLHLPDSNVIKAANKYRIKKQIDYTQIDPFLNDPMDNSNRPLRFHSQVKQFLQQKQKYQEKQYQLQRNKEKALSIVGNIMLNQNIIKPTRPKSNIFLSAPLQWNNVQQKQSIADSLKTYTNNEKLAQNNLTIQPAFNLRKKIDRKLGFNLSQYDKTYSIINQIPLTADQIANYLDFRQELEDRLLELVGGQLGFNCFNDQNDKDSITVQQENYLFRVNRYKYNPGVQKLFVQIKKQRKYFHILKQISEKYGYRTYGVPLIYSEFKLANKNKKFFDRLQRVLLYKQMVVSPYGQLSLFTKMERIKLAYSVLREHVRIENIYMFNANIFALSDKYEKFGQIGTAESSTFHYYYHEQDRPAKQGIFGGLDGRNLQSDWNKLFVWSIKYNTIRNYLGESKSFQFFIKTSMILLFAILTPFGVFFQVIKRIFITPQAAVVGYFPQFYFYLAYMLIVVIIYGIFTQKYRRSEQIFIQNFVQQDPIVQFKNEYRGPYMRDTKNDNANTYDNNTQNTNLREFKDKAKTFVVFALFCLLLGAQIGFYYGMRSLIVNLSYEMPEFDSTRFYLLRPIHLIGYGTFFVANTFIYLLLVIPLAKYLTKFENRPTQQSFLISENLKLYIFAIGIQMIGPIDLVFIQYADKTSCSANWCARELQAYVYCRYILILLFALLFAIDMVRRFLKVKKIKLFQKHVKADLTFARKLGLFLQFVYEQSKKQPCADIKLVDETVAMVLFATFLTVFPLGSAFSFASMLIDYNVERIQMLRNQQRPISKSQSFQTYRKILVAIGHWMLFFNFAQMFITLEWFEYLFPKLVLTILGTPTPYTMMTLKYSTILIFMAIYQVILLITAGIVQRFHSIMDKRKWNMLQKYGIKTLSSGEGVVLKQPKPLHSISRTFKLRKSNSEDSDSQEDEEEPHTHDDLMNKKSPMKFSQV